MILEVLTHRSLFAAVDVRDDSEKNASAPSSRLVVQSLRGPPELSPFAQDLTEELVVYVGELGQKHGFTVLSETEVNLLVDHTNDVADLSLEDCRRAEECLRRISEAARAELILYGRIDLLGDTYVAVVSLLDVAEGNVDRSETCTGATKQELLAALLPTAARVLDLDPDIVLDSNLDADLNDSNPEDADGPKIEPSAKVGVVPIEGPENPSIALTLTQILGVEIRRYDYAVQTRDELMAMLDYAADRHAIQNSGAPLDQALIEIASAMGVDNLATGTIGSFDDTLVIVLKLIDVGKAKVVRRVAESYRGPIAHLPTAMRFATAKLFGREISGSGDLVLVTDAEGHFRIDHGDKRPLSEDTNSVTGLEAAKHHLNIQADGYYPYSIDVYIDPAGDQPLRLRPELVERPTPWYKSGLFWGVAGVVLAGTTTAILLATVPPGGSHVGGTL